MTAKQILPPALAVLTLEQVKEHLRISSNAEDNFLVDLIAAATALAEKETGLSLITQTWRLWLDALPEGDVALLPSGPVQRITQVIWFDADGTPTNLAGNAYFLNTLTKPARLRFDRSACPIGFCNGIEIDFEAGFGDTGLDVPDMLKRALLALIAHWYEFRGVYSASEQPVSVPETYTRLTRHYRQPRL